MPHNPHRALHDSFSDAWKGADVASHLVASLLARKFSASGIRLKRSERDALENACQRIAAGDSPEILEALPIVRRRAKTVDLAPAEGEIDGLLQKLEEATTRAALDIASKQAFRYSPEFAKWSATATVIHDAEVANFRERCAREWRTPFARLSKFLFACTNLGEDFMAELALAHGEGTKLAPKLSALFLLHARGCLVAREVEALLHAGFADGAIARWRTLHEIAVIASFLSSHDADVAQRYLEHEAIESSKAAALYQRHVERLGLEPFSVETLEELKEVSAQLQTKHGAAFEGEYGWAAPAFAGRAPRFAHIEESVRLDHFRPYFKMASQQTHASMKGAVYRLGLSDLMRSGRDIFLVGPTNSGYTDPAQLTSLSLLQVMTCLLAEEPVLDRLVLMKVLIQMQGKIPPAFMNVERRIREREMKLRETSTYR